MPPGAVEAADPVPGMAAADFGVPGARRMGEGAFISRRPGVLVHIPSGEWVFVPRPIVESSKDGTDGPPRAASLDRPLIVLPSQTLERLEAAMATVEEGREDFGRLERTLSVTASEYLLPQQPSSLSAASVEPTSAPPGALPPSGQPEKSGLAHRGIGRGVREGTHPRPGVASDRSESSFPDRDRRGIHWERR